MYIAITITLSLATEPGKYYDGVRIATGSQKGAGTSNTAVYITLTGDKASSEKVGISSWVKARKGSCKRRTFDDLTIEFESDDDLGQVLVVGIGNEKKWFAGSGAPWYVDYVVVHNFQSGLNEEFLWN